MLKELLERQIPWSKKTFGEGKRTKGITSHIRAELKEIEDNPTDLSEWIDVILLGLDGAWRSGHTPEQIIECLVVKQNKNFKRNYPFPTSEDDFSQHNRDMDHPNYESNQT